LGKPIYVKIGASRPYYDVKLAVKAGADVIVLDGMQGGTAATQEVFIEHVGIPILSAIPQAVQALQEMGMHRKVQLIVSGGIRNGADVAKAMALGADAVAIGTAALIALGDNHPRLDEELKKSARPPVSTTTGRTAATRPVSPPRTRNCRSVWTRWKAVAAGQLPAGDGAGGPDHGPGLRQVAPAQPRSRGPGGADGGVGRHGPGAVGGDQLDSGFGLLSYEPAYRLLRVPVGASLLAKVR
jgi:hypothetical protein